MLCKDGKGTEPEAGVVVAAIDAVYVDSGRCIRRGGDIDPCLLGAVPMERSQHVAPPMRPMV